MDLKEKIIQAQKLPIEAQIIFWKGIFEKVHENAYNRGKWHEKVIRGAAIKRNQMNREDFYKELHYLKTHPFIEDDYLKALNNNMPEEVQKLRNTLRITLQDIADMTKKEADLIYNGALELRKLVYKITTEAEDKKLKRK